MSILRRETKTEKSDTHSIGVIYVSVLTSSIRDTPGASDNIFLISSMLIFDSNSILTDSACPIKTGTLTHVALTSIELSKIFFVSSTIFCSSFVVPSSKNLSM